MQVATLLFSILVVGSLALPAPKDAKNKELSKKQSRYPKKYEKTVYGVDLKEKNDVSQSSYLGYELLGQMDAMRPPSTSSDYIYVVNPLTEMVAPPQDSYSSYEGASTGTMKPPSEDGQRSDDVYFGYTEAEGEKGDVLTAPKLSSYADAGNKDEADDASSIKSFASGLRPPMPIIEVPVSKSSSYLSLEAPSGSLYSHYDKESADKTEMSPPSSQSHS